MMRKRTAGVVQSRHGRKGGYALLPGSLHPSGRRYEVISGDFANIPAVPQAVADALLNAARKLDEAPLTRKQMEVAGKGGRNEQPTPGRIQRTSKRYRRL